MRISGGIEKSRFERFQVQGRLVAGGVIKCNRKLLETSMKVRRDEALVRQDIVKNEPDRYGFRPPSPYSSNYSLVIPANGTIQNRADQIQSYCGFTPAQGGMPFAADGISGNVHLRDMREDFSAFLTVKPFGVKPKQQLVNSAFSKLKDQRINLSMTLAFVGQTSRMISSRAYDLANVYRLLRNGEIRRAAKYLRLRKWKTEELPKLYLEVLFGWGQLYRDLMGAYEELNKKSVEKSYLVTGRATSKANRNLTVTRPGYSCTLQATGTLTTQTTCRVIGRVTTVGLHKAATLGLLNPAEILWDVLRFSWIIDQFVHVGGYLSAYDATAGLQYLGGSFTTYTASNGVVDVSVPIRSTYDGDQGHFVMRASTRELVRQDDISIAIRNPFQSNVAVAAAAVGALIITMRGGGPIPRSYRA